jgi:glutathione S-transferase
MDQALSEAAAKLRNRRTRLQWENTMARQYTFVTGTKNWSSWSLRPYVALRATGAEFAEDVILLRRPDTAAEIARRSPSGRIPVLTVHEGAGAFSVWDSLAICETLAERHPEAQLWPKDGRARAEARAVSAEMHAGFANLREQLPMDFARALPTPELRPETKAEIARVLMLWTTALAKSGGPFLYGPLSIADCMYAPICSRFTTYRIQMPDAAKAYVSRMLALPALADWGRAAQKEVETGQA